MPTSPRFNLRFQLNELSVFQEEAFVAPGDGVGGIAPGPDGECEQVAQRQKPEVAQDLAVAENADAYAKRQRDAEHKRETEEREGGQAEPRGDEVQDGPGEFVGEEQAGIATAPRVAHAARPAQLMMQVAGEGPLGDVGLDDFVRELDTEAGAGDAGA